VKRKHLSLTRKLGPIVIYSDDLRAIAEIITEASKSVSISLKSKSDEYEFDSVAELEKLGDLEETVFHNAEISSRGDIYITVSLNPFQARIYLSEDNTYGRGLLEKIQEILQPKNKYIFFFFLTPIFSWPLFLFGISLYVKSKWISIIIILVALGWFAVGYKVSFKQYCTIYTKKRQEMPSFFKRKKDDLILAAISGIIGAIFGALAIAILRK
jgi:hypothetical protein